MARFSIQRHVAGQKSIYRCAKVRVEFDLRRSDVVNIIAVAGHMYGRVGQELSQAAAYRVVHHALYWEGRPDICAGRIPPRHRSWVDGEEASEESKQWAEAQVSRFWPKTEEDS